jgi:hypothetical protein
MSEARFKVTYKPEGVEPRTWEIDVLDDLKASEMIALKKVSGGAISGVSPLMQGLMDMDGEAWKGLLWLLLKRSLSTVPWDGLDFTFGDLEIDNAFEESEGRLRARLEAMSASGDLNAIGKAKLDDLVARGVEPEREDADDPKA